MFVVINTKVIRLQFTFYLKIFFAVLLRHGRDDEQVLEGWKLEVCLNMEQINTLQVNVNAKTSL